MSQAEQAQTAAEPLFHDMDGKPVYIGDRVELVSRELVVAESIGKVVTVDSDNEADESERLFLMMVGRKPDDFFISNTTEPGLAYPKAGVRKVEVQ